MIIYNVTIKVDPEIKDSWVLWMKEEHIPELMKTGLFIDHRMSRLLEQDEADGVTFVVQYFCDNMEHYNTYLNEHSTAIRDKAMKKFGGKFAAFRTVMEVITG